MTTGPIGPGTVLAGRYRLEDLLTESEGARFWRATDTVLARSVAIHAVASEDPRSAALMEAARVSATVTDPHLLRVLDCDDSEGITWVVNEWGDGVSLDLMLQQGTLPPSRAAWLTREVADAIAAGHARGVAHGRLNPEAVLVTHAGAVKLIGYVVDASLEPPRPPDPLYGELDDREADVIDLAGILYAALTGKWPGVSRSAVPRAPRESRRPLRPRQVRAGVPRTLDMICERVLHKEASQHAMPIETAHEIAAALADFVGDSGQAAPLEPSAMHVEPTVSIPRGDPEATQLSAAVPRSADLESTQLHREPLESPESLTPLRAPVVEADPPPPPFEDLPERPLFADTERRVPAAAGGVPPAAGLDTWGDSTTGRDDTGPTTGTGGAGTGGFWPFTDEEDPHNDVHTGREGRGWLRIAVVVALLILVVVAMAIAFSRGRQDGGATPTDQGSTSPSASADARGATIDVSSAKDFDPEGEDKSENPDTVGNTIDGDPATTWRTTTYFNNPALGGLKPGVGVMLDLGKEQAVGSVALQLKGQPTSVEVYAAPTGVTQAPQALDQLDKVGAKAGAPEKSTITLDQGTTTRFVLVWLTRLPPAPGGYRGEIAEISLRS